MFQGLTGFELAEHHVKQFKQRKVPHVSAKS